MKKRLASLTIAAAGVLAFASPSAAVPSSPIVITPGFPSVIPTDGTLTFEFSGCEGGTVEFVLAFHPADGSEVFQFLGSAPGGPGSWTFTPTGPGIFKIIVNCFIGGERDSTEEVHFEVVDSVPTTPPPVVTTAPAVTTAPPVATTAAGAATTIAGATTTVASGGPALTTTPTTASALSRSALPATGQGDGTALLVSAATLLVLGGTLVLVRRRPA